jgi:hypothetical protein
MKTPETLALEYPQMKADTALAQKQVFELCQTSHGNLKARKHAIISLPHQKTDFDMNLIAALDELNAYREIGTVEFIKEELYDLETWRDGMRGD